MQENRVSVVFQSWTRNWAGDEAGGISTGQIMKEGRTMKEGQSGSIEGFEAWGWARDMSITFIV